MTDRQKNTQHIKLYAGPEHACGYLEEQTSISVFADPGMEMDNALYSELSRLGFRRSGSHVYRPQCPSCSACWTYRVQAQEFQPNKTQKRIAKANQQLKTIVTPAMASAEDYEIYEQYIGQRHKDGDMYPPSFQQYEEFLFSDWCTSILLKLIDQDDICHGVMVLDLLDDGLSAVYSFFDPDSPYKSLGVYLILESIALCQTNNLTYCYLGYFIQNCQKMNYKQNYKPAEIYKNNHWQVYPKNE